MNLDSSLVWVNGIDPEKVMKIDDVYEMVATNNRIFGPEFGTQFHTTYRVKIMDKHFERVIPIGFVQILEFKENPAFSETNFNPFDPAVKYEQGRRPMAYLMKTDIVLLEPAELMSGRFNPYLRGEMWRRRTV